MISTSFEAWKNTLTKEPSGSDVKKEYCVGCFQKSDWDFIHVELMKDGSLEDNIPTDKCDCINAVSYTHLTLPTKRIV